MLFRRKENRTKHVYNITLTLDICEDKFSYKLNFFCYEVYTLTFTIRKTANQTTKRLKFGFLSQTYFHTAQKFSILDTDVF